MAKYDSSIRDFEIHHALKKAHYSEYDHRYRRMYHSNGCRFKYPDHPELGKIHANAMRKHRQEEHAV